MRRQISPSTSVVLTVAAVCLLTLQAKISSQSFSAAPDPGVRGGAAGAGDPLPGITAHELEYFNAGQLEFEEADEVDELPLRDAEAEADVVVGAHAVMIHPARPIIRRSTWTIPPRSRSTAARRTSCT